jgi:2-iminobutanoate/2-iminopropanoate deaminase
MAVSRPERIPCGLGLASATGKRYRRRMQLDVVATEDAPRAIGPYSQAVQVAGSRMVFCSGQIPIDPRSGELVGAGDIRQQTFRVMKNLEAVLTAAGTSFAEVVKTTVYLVDLGDFAAMNEVYAGFFPSKPPARATVQVAALPRGAQVEIEAIAVVG